jgi:hypothetical protein
MMELGLGPHVGGSDLLLVPFVTAAPADRHPRHCMHRVAQGGVDSLRGSL